MSSSRMWNWHSKSSSSELDEAEEGFLQSEELDGYARSTISGTNGRRRGWEWLRTNWSWVLQTAMLLCSSTLFLLSWYHEPSDATCTRSGHRRAAPALEAVTYHDETLQGEFLQPSPYRGTPTPEIDARWEEIADGNAFNVASDKLHLLNKSSSDPWHHTAPEFGGGVAAQSWGFHQLHCLNLLRQASYEDEYRQAGRLPEILRATKEVRRNHLDHCIEVVRLDMMCQADVTPYFVMEAAPGHASDALRIDFSVFKKCRDFGKIKSWMKDRVAIASSRDSFLDS
ncbi:Cyclochlorotine biosynthesis protein O [Apiospora aurea]|uniref:Cyclochlorotine biosynthesis protein O n=1 Tax=Apiospora aurea TaxID=335848 RepID=A0ABR1QSU1_9PEZI